jgi:DNA polymerase III subunit alpha, Gram-positive type
MSLLRYTSFQNVLFPSDKDSSQEEVGTFKLRRTSRFQILAQSLVKESSFVVFDLETTGLDCESDRIIEIGAQKIVGTKVVDEFSSLISVTEQISSVVEKLTGISNSMLKGQPKIEPVLGKFIDFIKGSILVAHNATFDVSFLRAECSRLGLDMSWPALCTLKMARQYLSELESKSLDSIAEHYGFAFESRHRSIGDVKVTVSLLQELFARDDFPVIWKDCSVFEV